MFWKWFVVGVLYKELTSVFACFDENNFHKVPAERCFMVMLSLMNWAFETGHFELPLRLQVAYVSWHSYCDHNHGN
eukprot:12410101-Karenia_brevis.AAC.1